MGELSEKAKGLANETAGNVKQAVGNATGNEKTKAEGVAQERKGEAQHVKGDIEGAMGNKV